MTAAAGDEGYLGWFGPYEKCIERLPAVLCKPSYQSTPFFPASSPDVVAVGGTRLELSESGAWTGEQVWNGQGAGGSGCSNIFAAASWQRSVSDWSSVGCGGARAVADVAADADPYTGLAVYDSLAPCEYTAESGEPSETPWCTIGGTSLASPLIAATFALAGGADGAPYPARLLYENEAAQPGSLHDVTSGSNGGCGARLLAGGLAGCTIAEEAQACGGDAICQARSGYDGPSGVGTPDGLAAFRQPTAPFQPGVQEPGNSEGHNQGAGPKENALRVTGLALTAHSKAALRSTRRATTSVAFELRANESAPVRVRLYRRVRIGRRYTWRATGATRVIDVRAGSSSWTLATRGALARGVYRIVLSQPGHGDLALLAFTSA